MKKSDRTLWSYLYCRSTLRHSEVAEPEPSSNRNSTHGANLGSHRWVPTTPRPPPEQGQARLLQKGTKVTPTAPGTLQLPWCLTSILPFALGRQGETVYYCSPRRQRTCKDHQESSKLEYSQGLCAIPASLCWGDNSNKFFQHPLAPAGTAREWAEPTTAGTGKSS